MKSRVNPHPFRKDRAGSYLTTTDTHLPIAGNNNVLILRSFIKILLRRKIKAEKRLKYLEGIILDLVLFVPGNQD